jgi:hypothetical protein
MRSDGGSYQVLQLRSIAAWLSARVPNSENCSARALCRRAGDSAVQVVGKWHRLPPDDRRRPICYLDSFITGTHSPSHWP